VTGEAMNEKPIGKYSGYADAARYIRADIDYVRRRFAFTSMKRFIEMRFFLLAFPPNCARRYFAASTDLNCLLFTFRCFIFSLQPLINTIM